MNILKVLVTIECPECVAHTDDPYWDSWLQCSTCRGGGTIQQWVTIRELADDIRAEVNDASIPAA